MMMSLSVRSAIPTEHSIPKLSAFALMYGVRKPVTSVANPRYERGSSAAINGTITAIVIAESVTRSIVESKKPPQRLAPFCEIRAMAPSKRSLSAKITMKIVPQKNSSLG
jgi:hypothetical protein